MKLLLLKSKSIRSGKAILFDEISSILKRSGIKCRLFRDLDNPNTVFILIEWDNLENAKVTESEDL
jgi:signal recognition particle subunit SEC65